MNIKATKIELTKEIREYIDEKMIGVEKRLGSINPTHFDVEIGLAVGGQSSGDIYRCEVNLDLPGHLIRVERTESDVFKAIDSVKDNLLRAIEKYKNK